LGCDENENENVKCRGVIFNELQHLLDPKSILTFSIPLFHLFYDDDAEKKKTKATQITKKKAEF